MKSIVILFLFSLLIISCSDDGTSPNINSGRIIGKITVGHNNLIPKNKLEVEISSINPNNGNLSKIESVFTDDKGQFIISNLTFGDYLLYPLQDENYGESSSQVVSISDTNITSRIEMWVKAFHHFSRDTIEFPIDTNSISISMSTKFFNDGIRDTLKWQMDTTVVPDWFYISPKNDIYPPENDANSNRWITSGINKFSFPYNDIPILLKLPLHHQYGLDTLYYYFLYK
jgi:hypothetical protein